MSEATSHEKAKDDLTETRLNYAWEWYKLHAQQRATFLRFFLISTGVLLSGYIAAFDNEIYYAAFLASLLGATQSVVFIVFDERNLHFVRRAIGVLEELENRLLFPDDFVSPDEAPVGLLRRGTGTRRKDRQQRFRGEGEVWKIKIWVRTLQLSIEMMFIILMILPLAQAAGSKVPSGIPVFLLRVIQLLIY